SVAGTVGKERPQIDEGLMAKRYVVLWMAVLIVISSFAVWVAAQDQDQNSVIRVVVAMVQLNVAVIDGKGNYVTNLHPSDFVISEDGIPQNVATFEEGIEGPQNVLDAGKDPKSPKGPDPTVQRRTGDVQAG